jgi:RNA polymerase sigma-70 factor (ECF subfamily)
MIRQAIGALPPEQKTLIVLCDIEGRSYEEIAQITHLKLGTVKSKLARARQRLRCWLEGVTNS